MSKKEKFYCKVGQATINAICFMTVLAVEAICIIHWVLK